MAHLHVLHADDEPETRQLVGAALSLDPFFTVRSCSSGAEVLTTAVAWRPDLVLLDDAMPDMDGPAVLARLRSNRRTAPIPVIFLTARTDLAARQRFIALGAAGVLAKPFDPVGFAAQVRRFVAVEGVLRPARESFMRRLKTDASALSVCRSHLRKTRRETLVTINAIAHSLAGAGGIYGFAGITSASAALSEAAERNLAGRARPIEVERALNRLLERIAS